VEISDEADELELLRLRRWNDVHEKPKDSLSALHGCVERTVGIRIQLLHRNQNVSCPQREKGLVRVDAHVLAGIDIERSLIDEEMVFHDEHALVLVPTVLLALVRFPIASFIAARHLKGLSLAAHGRRRA